MSNPQTSNYLEQIYSQGFRAPQISSKPLIYDTYKTNVYSPIKSSIISHKRKEPYRNSDLNKENSFYYPVNNTIKETKKNFASKKNAFLNPNKTQIQRLNSKMKTNKIQERSAKGLKQAGYNVLNNRIFGITRTEKDSSPQKEALKQREIAWNNQYNNHRRTHFNIFDNLYAKDQTSKSESLYKSQFKNKSPREKTFPEKLELNPNFEHFKHKYIYKNIQKDFKKVLPVKKKMVKSRTVAQDNLLEKIENNIRRFSHGRTFEGKKHSKMERRNSKLKALERRQRSQADQVRFIRGVSEG